MQMYVSNAEMQKRNKTPSNGNGNEINMYSNDLDSNNSGTFTSGFLAQFKSNQNDGISIASSNCILPKINLDDVPLNQTNQNNSNHPETFITDKIKDNKPKEKELNINNDTNEEEDNGIPNILNPFVFNQLCIDLEEQRANQLKGINPLFFVINGERKIDKAKYRNIPLKTKPTFSFKLNSKNDDYMKYIQKQFDQLQQKKLVSSYHESLKTTTFVNCFSKSVHDKHKIKTDWKKVIFNNQKDNYEAKVGLIKDIIKTEMTNRSIGRGIFSNNTKYRYDKIRKWKESFEQKKKERKEHPLLIDLKKKECFDKKPLTKTAEIFFNRNFLRLTFDSYRQQKERKAIVRKKTKELNLDLQKIYYKNNNNLFDD